MINKLEPIVLLLFAAMIFFTGALFAAEKWYPNDGQIFQVVSGLLTGISGAFLMRVKPQSAKADPAIDDPQSSSTTTVVKEVLQAKAERPPS